MADQQRWFKFWVTAPYDDDLMQLPPEWRWAWVVLGAYTKAHGTHGQVTLSPSNAPLWAAMNLKPDVALSVIKQLPHMHVDVRENRHGTFTVTWQNWVKYQEDSTQAKRQMSRRKKRREEIRKDETRTKTETTTKPAVLTDEQFVDSLRSNPAYTGIGIDQELSKMQAWCDANRRQRTRRFVVNWLNKQQAVQVNGGPPKRARLNDVWAGKPSGEVQI
mgnify:CR=1 FL=1